MEPGDCVKMQTASGVLQLPENVIKEKETSDEL